MDTLLPPEPGSVWAHRLYPLVHHRAAIVDATAGAVSLEPIVAAGRPRRRWVPIGDLYAQWQRVSKAVSEVQWEINWRADA